MSELTNQIEKVDQRIREALPKAQESDAPNALSNVNPTKWLEIAGHLTTNGPKTTMEIMCKKGDGTSFKQVKSVQLAIQEAIKPFKEWMVQAKEINYSTTLDLQNMMLEDAMKRGGMDDKEAKALKDVSASIMMIGQEMRRMAGEADKVIETRTVKSPEELMSEFKDKFGDTIEVEAEIVK